MSHIKSVLGKHGISAGDHVQRKAIKWNNSEKHKVLGFLGSRAIGVIGKPIARIGDVAIHIILAVGKITVGTFTAPFRHGPKFMQIDKLSTTDWTVKKGLFHIGFAIVFFADIVVSPLTNFISPNIDPLSDIDKEKTATDAIAAEEEAVLEEWPGLQNSATERLMAELAAVNAEREILKRLFDSRQETVLLERHHSDHLQKNLETAQKNLETVQNEKALVDEELTQARDTIEELSQELGKKDITNTNERTELQARVDTQFQEIIELEKTNAEQAQEIIRLQNLLNEKVIREIQLGNENSELNNSLLEEGNKTAEQEKKIKELDEASQLAEKKAQEAEKQVSEAKKEIEEVKLEVEELKSEAQIREEYIEELVLESVALIKNRMIDALEGEKPKSLPPKARLYIWQNKDHQALENLSESLEAFGPLKFEKALLAKKKMILSGLAEYKALKDLVGRFERNSADFTVQEIQNAINHISKEDLQEIAEEQQLLDDSANVENTKLMTVSFLGDKEASPGQYLKDLKMHLQIKLAQIHNSMDYLETNLERAKKTKLVDREVREKAEMQKKVEENLKAEAATKLNQEKEKLLNEITNKARSFFWGSLKVTEELAYVKLFVPNGTASTFDINQYSIQQLAQAKGNLGKNIFEKYRKTMNEYLATDEGVPYEQFRNELFLD